MEEQTQVVEAKPEEMTKEQKIEITTPLLEKALKEKRNAMLENTQLKQKLQDLQEAELKAKEDFKTLYEQSKIETDNWKSKFSQIQDEITTGRKLSALKTELSKRGAGNESLEFLLQASKNMMEELKYDDEHRVVLGAEALAERIQASIPAAFSKPIPNVTHSAPQTVPSSIDLESFKKMSLEDKRKHQATLFEKAGIALKK